jgi:hypothetical protein
MKTKSILAISAASLLVAGAVILHRQAAAQSNDITLSSSPISTRAAERRAERKVDVDLRERALVPENKDFPKSDEAANLAGWQERFDQLLAGQDKREEAVRLLLTEVDAVFSHWVQEQITPLAELPASQRYDRLAEIEISVQEGAAAVLEQINIEGSRRVTVAAGALEAVAAEIQYAEAAPDHRTRMAMLRLDREREQRLGQALALADETVRNQAINDLDVWYEAGMGKIFPSDDVN